MAEGDVRHTFSVRPLSSATPPDLLSLHHADSARYPFLLQSVSQGPLGRYDILFAFPEERLELRSPAEAEAFLNRWRNVQPVLKPFSSQPSLPPFTGGWFAFFAYEYAQVIEPVLQLPQPDLPLAVLVNCPAALIYDHQSGQLYGVAEQGHEACLDTLAADWRREADWGVEAAVPPVSVSEAPPEVFLEGVARIRAYIYAGDVFQVNLSRPWEAELASDTTAAAVYAALRRANPAPFAALADFDDWQIISSSPERLVRYDGQWLETRPIAGTRRRGRDSADDARMVQELLETVKERAEHIMLIDLERNDLGRICQPGTVEVNELMVVESYQHVHHIVSNVRGMPHVGLTPQEVVHALFPGGTITGCPKIRCMEIIAELEQAPRHAYTGAVGYINYDGRMDLNILIRTLVKRGQKLSFRAGAGIVADAHPEHELRETRHKAAGLLEALR